LLLNASPIASASAAAQLDVPAAAAAEAAAALLIEGRVVPFVDEGHVSLFRIRNGRVNFRSRFVRNERYSLPVAACQ